MKASKSFSEGIPYTDEVGIMPVSLNTVIDFLASAQVIGKDTSMGLLELLCGVDLGKFRRAFSDMSKDRLKYLGEGMSPSLSISLKYAFMFASLVRKVSRVSGIKDKSVSGELLNHAVSLATTVSKSQLVEFKNSYRDMPEDELIHFLVGFCTLHDEDYPTYEDKLSRVLNKYNKLVNKMGLN